MSTMTLTIFSVIGSLLHTNNPPFSVIGSLQKKNSLFSVIGLLLQINNPLFSVVGSLLH